VSCSTLGVLVHLSPEQVGLRGVHGSTLERTLEFGCELSFVKWGVTLGITEEY
jgi:hypothetical protein